jgi:hypothetical protein
MFLNYSQNILDAQQIVYLHKTFVILFRHSFPNIKLNFMQVLQLKEIKPNSLTQNHSQD